MSVTYPTWSQLQLCTVDDVRKEIHDLAVPLQRTQQAQTLEEICGEKIEVAKDLVRQRLMNVLPDIFASSVSLYGLAFSLTTWIINNGYSYSQLDTILDKIQNPEVLKSCMVAKTISCMLADGMSRQRAQQEENMQLLFDLYTFWDKEFEKRFNMAFRVLHVDLNLDGNVQWDSERVRTRMVVWSI